ncbi:MAG: DUF2619 domain-containing protein [Firmicutes bacterium]|nr:DUF2619 domain-containing protein [Bacillota bacterium]
MEQAILKNMAAIRVISGVLEIAAAFIFLRVGRVDSALRLNAMLGLVGPLVFIAVSALGIAAVAVRLPWYKIVMIVLGICLVLGGTKG